MRRATYLCAALVLVMCAPASAAPRLVSAGPRLDRTDIADSSFRRVTFSPNGDGIADRVRVTVITAEPERVRLEVRRVSQSDLLAVADTVDTTPGFRAVLTWNGRVNGLTRVDGSYVLSVCSRTGCARQRVLAHLRNLTVIVRTARSVQRNTLLPLRIDSDHGGSFDVDIVPDAFPRGEPTKPVALRRGSRFYRVPTGLRGGLYRIRVRDDRGSTRFAPVVVRSHSPFYRPYPGTALIVYPFMTWRAYSDGDYDRDGRMDSWYAHPADPYVPLVGPFEPARYGADIGAEHTAQRTRPLARWLQRNRIRAQHITDVELASVPQRVLDRYSAIVLMGHVEYYEPRAYDLVKLYLDRGGRLISLSANAFYSTVKIEGNRMTRLDYPHRTATRSDYAIAVTGFRKCCWSKSSRPRYRITAEAIREVPWMFTGTGLHAGSRFGEAHAEADSLGDTSPSGSVTIARARVGDVTLEMGYVRLEGGGEVFNAGNVGFGYNMILKRLPKAERDAIDRFLLNIWTRMVRPRDAILPVGEDEPAPPAPPIPTEEQLLETEDPTVEPAPEPVVVASP